MSGKRPVWHTLWFKLTAAFLLIGLVGVVVVAVLANQATARGFQLFLVQDEAAQWRGLQEQLSTLYQEQGHWNGADRLLNAALPGPGQGQGGARLTLLDADGQVVAETRRGQGRMGMTGGNNNLTLPIEVNGRTVGTLEIVTPMHGNNNAGEAFLLQVNRAIWLGGLAALALALLLGALLAGRLTRPLRQLTQATRALAQGDLQQQVSLNSQDELGELAASFNQTAAALAAAEQQRQQLLADVAHELRTPLSVMRGHIEAMLDGVFATTPDNLAVVHEETVLLGRLVDDLRTLSLAEGGQLPLNHTDVDLAALLRQSVAAFEPLAEAENIRLQQNIPDNLPLLEADPDRLQQVLGNLLANALRHVRAGNAAQPTVRLAAVAQNQTVQIRVSDNGPGLSAEARAHVFERFWRADAARSRDQGGSGLGLAICRAIVELHNGRIWVGSEPGQGATFIVELPNNFT